MPKSITSSQAFSISKQTTIVFFCGFRLLCRHFLIGHLRIWLTWVWIKGNNSSTSWLLLRHKPQYLVLTSELHDTLFYRSIIWEDTLLYIFIMNSWYYSLSCHSLELDIKDTTHLVKISSCIGWVKKAVSSLTLSGDQITGLHILYSSIIASCYTV